MAVFQLDIQAEFKLGTITMTYARKLLIYLPGQRLPCASTLTFTIMFSVCYTKLSPLDIIGIGECMRLSFVMTETLH